MSENIQAAAIARPAHAGFRLRRPVAASDPIPLARQNIRVQGTTLIRRKLFFTWYAFWSILMGWALAMPTDAGATVRAPFGL